MISFNLHGNADREADALGLAVRLIVRLLRCHFLQVSFYTEQKSSRSVLYISVHILDVQSAKIARNNALQELRAETPAKIFACLWTLAPQDCFDSSIL